MKRIIAVVVLSVIMTLQTSAAEEESIMTDPAGTITETVVGIEPGQPTSAELDSKMNSNLQRFIWELSKAHGYDYNKTCRYYAYLIGVADAESNFYAGARNDVNSDGSTDYGMYQINSYWLKTFRNNGYISTYRDLFDPYTSARCADYILSDIYEKHGFTEMTYCCYLYGTEHKSSVKTRYAWEKVKKWHLALNG